MLVLKIAIAVYVAAMLIPYGIATVQGVRNGRISTFKAIIMAPFGFAAFLIVLPVGVAIGILKPRKAHV